MKNNIILPRFSKMPSFLEHTSRFPREGDVESQGYDMDIDVASDITLGCGRG